MFPGGADGSTLTSVAGGDAVVPGARGAAPVQLRHAGGPVERRLHLRRDVQEEVSGSRPAPLKGIGSSPLNAACCVRARSPAVDGMQKFLLVHIFTLVCHHGNAS